MDEQSQELIKRYKRYIRRKKNNDIPNTSPLIGDRMYIF